MITPPEHWKNLTLDNIKEVVDGVLIEEQWKDIEGYEQLYQASTFGRIKSLLRTLSHPHSGSRTIIEKILCQAIRGENCKYLIVSLCDKNKKIKTESVHRLVGKTYHANPQSKAQINHIDTNKLNNFYLNLEWHTSKQNRQHAIANGLIKSPSNTKFKANDILEIRKIYDSGVCGSHKIAKQFGVAQSTIMRIVKRKSYIQVC